MNIMVNHSRALKLIGRARKTLNKRSKYLEKWISLYGKIYVVLYVGKPKLFDKKRVKILIGRLHGEHLEEYDPDIVINSSWIPSEADNNTPAIQLGVSMTKKKFKECLAKAENKEKKLRMLGVDSEHWQEKNTINRQMWIKKYDWQ